MAGARVASSPPATSQARLHVRATPVVMATTVASSPPATSQARLYVGTTPVATPGHARCNDACNDEKHTCEEEDTTSLMQEVQRKGP